jgi:hypothetical protein
MATVHYRTVAVRLWPDMGKLKENDWIIEGRQCAESDPGQECACFQGIPRRGYT